MFHHIGLCPPEQERKKLPVKNHQRRHDNQRARKARRARLRRCARGTAALPPSMERRYCHGAARRKSAEKVDEHIIDRIDLPHARNDRAADIRRHHGVHHTHERHADLVRQIGCKKIMEPRAHILRHA